MTVSADIRAAPTRPGFRQLVSLLPVERRRDGLKLGALMLVGGLAEMATVGAVVPFISVLTGQGREVRAWPLMPDLPTSVWAVAALFIAAALVATGVRLLLSWNTQQLATETGHWIAAEIHRRVLLQPYPFHVQAHSSTLVSALQKVQDLVWGVLLPGLQGATAGLIAALLLLGLLSIDAAAALAAGVLFAGVYALASVIVRHRLRRYSEIVGGAYDDRVRTLQETLGGIRDIIIDGSHAAHLEIFRNADRRFAWAWIRISFLHAAPRFIIEASGLVAIALLAVFLSAREGGLVAALPVLGALALGAQRLLPQFQQVYHSWSSITGHGAIVSDLTQLLQLPVHTTGAEDGPPMPFASELAIEAVSFTYSGRSAPALRDVDVRIPKGSRVALAGRTGSGKSTLADLVMGLLEPDSGRILVDGVELNSGNLAAWRRNIAHVPQSIFLADASIAENIAFGAAGAQIDQTRLLAAINSAQLGELVAELPEGLQTRIGERGVRLSGGQRQRLALARAIYRGKPLLVLDEATSALDEATEQAVLHALDELQSRGVTILIIAHRSSTLARCDLLVRLKAGRVVAIEAPG